MSPNQLCQFISTIAIPNRFPVLVTGAPGIGKTAIVKQACADAKADILIRHPVVEEPIDAKGYPMRVDGYAKFVPFEDFLPMYEAKKPTVVFIDDFGQARYETQAAYMQFFLARALGERRVSEFVTFIVATNRREDKAGVSGLLEPVKSRFFSIIELETSVDDWCEWAMANDMPHELIGFVRFKPDMLHNFKPTHDLKNSPCPRTVANVGRLFNAGIPDDIRYEVFAGAAGEAFAVEFDSFIRVSATLPSFEQIVLAPDKAPVPKEPSACYAVSALLTSRVEEINFTSVAKYLSRLPDEFSVLTMKDAIKRKPKIVQTKQFTEWSIKHKDVFVS